MRISLPCFTRLPTCFFLTFCSWWRRWRRTCHGLPKGGICALRICTTQTGSVGLLIALCPLMSYCRFWFPSFSIVACCTCRTTGGKNPLWVLCSLWNGIRSTGKKCDHLGKAIKHSFCFVTFLYSFWWNIGPLAYQFDPLVSLFFFFPYLHIKQFTVYRHTLCTVVHYNI